MAGTVIAASSMSLLETVLIRLRSKSATDPRDKMYGPYGMLGAMGITNLSTVGYRETQQQIYTATTNAHILHDQSLCGAA
jgi:hypothetical protein